MECRTMADAITLTEGSRADLFRAATETLAPGLSSSPPTLVIIVGAGISIATAGAPGWIQLLYNGCDYAWERHPLEREQIGRIRRAAKRGELFRAADDLRRLMGSSHFADFLRREFSQYRTNRDLVQKRGLYALLSALRHRGARIATTNYDTIIEDVLSLKEMDWPDQGLVSFFKSASPVWDRCVLHLHGVYTNPANVIFGSSDYEILSPNTPTRRAERQHLEHFLRDTLLSCHVLFVGCGDTMSDPHFKELFDFCAPISSSTPSRHVHLCTDSDYESMAGKLPSSIELAPYGSYEGLGIAIKRIFNSIFDPLDEAVRSGENRRAKVTKRREKHQRQRTDFPIGEIFLCPDDGLLDDYREFQEYWHVSEGFSWTKLPPSSESTDSHRKTNDGQNDPGWLDAVTAARIANASHKFYSAILQPAPFHRSSLSGEDSRTLAALISSAWRRSYSAILPPAPSLRALPPRTGGEATAPSDGPPPSEHVSASALSAAYAFCQELADKPRDSSGRGALHYLVLNEAVDLLRALFRVEPTFFDANAKDSDHMTPLHLAVFMNLPLVVQVFVEADVADLELEDVKGRTPFKMAWRKEHHVCMRLLAPKTEAHDDDPPNMASVLKRLKIEPDARIRRIVSAEESESE